jgi:AraC-like DNA-binding protein
MAFGLMYGPLIFHFVKSHLSENNGKSWIHFVPAFFLVLWIFGGEYFKWTTTIAELTILQVGVFLHIGIYLFQAYKSSKHYEAIAFQTRSQLDDDKIKLIQYNILFIGVLFLVSMIHSYTELGSLNGINQLLTLTISFIILIGMLIIIYQGMDKPHFYSSITPHEKELASEVNQYAGSTLTDESTNIKLERLKHVMKSEKPYKLENISIDKLAEITDIPSRHLSQIINQRLDQNFFDFINSHRIKDAQKQLESPSIRVSEVMYEVGFSSRSSFNTAFKKYTGMTPSQYRKSRIK